MVLWSPAVFFAYPRVAQRSSLWDRVMNLHGPGCWGGSPSSHPYVLQPSLPCFVVRRNGVLYILWPCPFKGSSFSVPSPPPGQRRRKSTGGKTGSPGAGRSTATLATPLTTAAEAQPEVHRHCLIPGGQAPPKPLASLLGYPSLRRAKDFSLVHLSCCLCK